MEHGVGLAAPCAFSHHHCSKTSVRHSAPSGYILLELVLALTIFSIAVLGLANSLSTSLEVANALNRENSVRIGLRSFLEEARKKPFEDMAMEAADERLGCTYSSIVEPAGLTSSSGRELTGLYKLTATALYTAGGKEETETVMVYVYQAQQSSGR